MISIRELSYAYPGQAPLFEDFNLHIPRGEAWAVIGPSGCGKSTLLYLLAGLLRPTRGEIHVAGALIVRPRPRTGFVLQDHGLLPWSTVEENAYLGWTIRGFYGPDGRHSPADMETDEVSVKKRVAYWLERLRIDHLRDKYPSHLSRGQRQRAALARTLSLEPDLLLMDEPFSALDAAIRDDLQKAMRNYHRESGITSVLVTHDIEEALFMGGHILVLNAGRRREAKVMENLLAGREDLPSLPEFRERLEALRLLLGGKG
ncbi:MAG: ATP-binding cassette domain-containing protein [Deltaproteobacteria bacterium]|nr:ATP-binding cassette domain-containing protein [Deltaproteobacteria bacterium]